MISWTEAGNDALEKHMAAIAPDLLARGLVPAQVASRLRIRLNDELARAGVSVAGPAEVAKVLARLEPGFAENPAPPGKRGSWILRGTGWIAALLFGVMGPVAALEVEAVTGMCRGIFDPLPTVWHMLAIAFVAFSNGWMMALAAAPGPARRLGAALACNAVATGIAAFYALWFIPITPFAVVAIIAFGLGLLPLSPLLALATGLVLRWKLKKRVGPAAGWRRDWPWALAAFALLVAFEVPMVFTHWAAMQAVRGTPGEQQQAVQLLRKFGREEQLLEHTRWGRRTDSFRAEVLRVLFGSYSEQSAQELYYRVTGRGHNAPPVPGSRARWWNEWRADRRGAGHEDFRWDDDLGGETVGQRFSELRLKESRLDGSLDGDGATGYLEWTLVFRNDNPALQREARALVQLPPGAVVSRLTLWINGEEREAAFGGRDQVRQAYQAVVQRRRDPVLVSSRGADRVLVQCFPVQPKGGEMKVRIGISLPLVLDTWGEAKTGLPRIIEQNFSEVPGLGHAVWIEARNPLTTTATGVRYEQTADGKQAVAFTVAPAQGAEPAVSVTVARDPALVQVQAVDRRNATRVIRQDFRRTAAGGVPCIVLDGAQDMAPAAGDLAAVLEKLPADTAVRLVLAGDVARECPYRTAAQVAEWVRWQEFVGGQDATDALLAASALLPASGGQVLWIHGRQPMVWKPAVALEQKLARSGGAVRFLALAGAEGPNVLVEKMAAAGGVVMQPRLGTLEADIARVVHRVQAGGIEPHRGLVAAGATTAGGPVVSDHVVRLWAADEVKRLMRGKQADREEAGRLAVAMQLVTPVSSAVVLETQAQYDAAGLQPVNPDTVPKVPEGGATLLLLAAGLIGLMIFSRHCKCRARAA